MKEFLILIKADQIDEHMVHSAIQMCNPGDITIGDKETMLRQLLAGNPDAIMNVILAQLSEKLGIGLSDALKWLHVPGNIHKMIEKL